MTSHSLCKMAVTGTVNIWLAGAANGTGLCVLSKGEDVR